MGIVGTERPGVGTEAPAVVATESLRAWQRALAPYARVDVRRSAVDLGLSLLPFLALMAGMFALVDVSYPLVLLLSIPAAGFLQRTFLVMHDCTHGSFMPTKRGNLWVGRLCGFMALQSFQTWRHEHVIHHAAGGDLSSDGVGDLFMFTVEDYFEQSRRRRLRYRIIRQPFVVLGIGGTWSNVIKPRFIFPSDPIHLRRSKVLTNFALAAALLTAGHLLGWGKLALVIIPAYWLAAVGGAWLIWVQHRFEGAQWRPRSDWAWADAALAASSHLELPKPLQFFTANVGLHHVHHLNPHIPNYNLPRANDENPFLRDVPTVSLWNGLRSMSLALYDPASGRLVSFREGRRLWNRRRGRTPRAGENL
jgi:acyl-lipid omega-6 desaturase (Delta-12 desaturase)